MSQDICTATEKSLQCDMVFKRLVKKVINKKKNGLLKTCSPLSALLDHHRLYPIIAFSHAIESLWPSRT